LIPTVPGHRLPADTARTGLVAMIAMPTLRSPLLPGRNVRIELFLLFGSQDRAQRRDLPLALPVHLRANLGHLRARRGGVTTLPRLARFLHHRAELLAVLLHFRLLLLSECLESGLLGVGEGDAPEQRTIRPAAPPTTLAVPSAMVALCRIRTSVRLLGLRGALGGDGQPLINGHAWTSAEALGLVREAAGADAWLEAADDTRAFDVLPLLVATDGAIAAFGRDGRRLRPNLVIGGVDGLREFEWPGSTLHINEVIIHLDSRRGRCPMTTVDPDTLERDPEVLRDIGRRFGGKLALNADVLRGGSISVGDRARVEPRTPEP